MEVASSHLLELLKLNSDLAKASETLGREEVRYLVDTYYQLQDFRLSSANRVRSLNENEEPHATLLFFLDQMKTVERQAHTALDRYSAGDPLGAWAREHVGVGPVIAAGLLAHIDISKVSSAGSVWRFAGLDPTLSWGKGQKRPYNARLKTLCWKLGDSFVKFQGKDECFYGKFYVKKKALFVAKNEAGQYADRAAETLEKKNIRATETLAFYNDGKLPPGRIDLMARRKAIKLFLAHYFEEGWRQLHGTEPPDPYPIAHMDGHTAEDKIESPVPTAA